MKYQRVFLIVIDSLGVGEALDANEYGDTGADTLGHISETLDTFNIPNLQKLGLANLHSLKQVSKAEKTLAYFTKLNEASIGKDTMCGHWEMMGIKSEVAFKTFSDTGFPKELLKALSLKTGYKIIGNKSASGTQILDELGEEQIRDHSLIVYTSADSVLQICGHEESMGLSELYRCCEIARELTMKEEWRVGRIIARPYLGNKKDGFKRTPNRHDYALKPPKKSYLNLLKEKGLDVISVGKINDIFVGEGITKAYKSKSSIHGMQQTLTLANTDFRGLCFVNLVDFDALWGHRRDPYGYGKELENFDVLLGKLLEQLKEDDLLIISADHGNDPTFEGSDHTREKVPFLAYSKSHKGSGLLSESDNFALIGATIIDNFNIKKSNDLIGESILKQLK